MIDYYGSVEEQANFGSDDLNVVFKESFEKILIGKEDFVDLR